MQEGDIVAIKADERFLPEQIIQGYLKCPKNGSIWIGKISKIRGEYALVAGGWRPIDLYDVMYKGE